MNNLIGEDNAVYNLSPFHITILLIRDNKRQEWFKTIGNDLCKYFVNDITKRDRPKLLGAGCPLLLRDKSDEGCI